MQPHRLVSRQSERVEDHLEADGGGRSDMDPPDPQRVQIKQFNRNPEKSSAKTIRTFHDRGLRKNFRPSVSNRPSQSSCLVEGGKMRATAMQNTSRRLLQIGLPKRHVNRSRKMKNVRDFDMCPSNVAGAISGPAIHYHRPINKGEYL